MKSRTDTCDLELDSILCRQSLCLNTSLEQVLCVRIPGNVLTDMGKIDILLPVEPNPERSVSLEKDGVVEGDLCPGGSP